MFNSWHQYSLGISPLFIVGFGVLAAVLAIAVVLLKGYSLWHAAKRNEKWWFIILLVVNTMGILELIYLIFVVKKWSKGVTAPAPTPGISNTGGTPTQSL